MFCISTVISCVSSTNTRRRSEPIFFFACTTSFTVGGTSRAPKMITGAIKRGEGILNVQRSMLESKTLRARGVSSREQGAQNVDGLWDQLQMLSGHVLPGLRNFRPSRNVLKGSYTQQATTQAVYSRRRL
ncbi:hypothetical protein TcCL_ESM08111 [Trypanosoma cruzi]|nr:hypothetical protein TcCL_ESM08111 [Trypanosoma cruzi]